MCISDIYWMEHSIMVSEVAPLSELRVGAVLVSECNELICSAYSGEIRGASWLTVLLRKLHELSMPRVEKAYITINTLSDKGSFDLVDFLEGVQLKEVYVGLPDPALSRYLEIDPVITLDCVFRYPDNLQRKILEQNECFFSASGQNIKNSPYYSEKRIGNLVIDGLRAQGFELSREEVHVGRGRGLLVEALCKRYEISYETAVSVVGHVLSEAFNTKYGAYDYSKDTRSFDLEWQKNFISLYKKISGAPLRDMNILNVGVGGGNEAIALFSECGRVTFVDIAYDGLNNILRELPNARVLVASADDLSAIPDDSYNLYVSLRTYNSAFFNIKEAIDEAYRVLRDGAVIIISVANGFLYPEQGAVIPGLIVPGTEFVDIYRGMDMAKIVYKELTRVGFRDINFFPTNTEIYLSAVV